MGLNEEKKILNRILIASIAIEILTKGDLQMVLLTYCSFFIFLYDF